MQNSRCERAGQSIQGWESKRQEHHRIREPFSMTGIPGTEVGGFVMTRHG